ncbi:bifunctional 4-hydroxy-2-oxoglutarate aldolase/2-dehydro-3-deoxy-phosphogluconate aldolase [Ruficoccus sp. ZRK36]|uniref:bifunctional 4-hydroxy-2-oxoglutarate aldolase/2-dehydro-3-deoxy-phosphogluconate aldolase n=1 Tax=Ruficoccus sp. ZRK36 TaxID=2866311 RepID=UPI001C735C4B|nr:bifunctional 4-hydroxy-2-oxoglutarate aldolase/2-dehydro-3-deoxy-phosphogluconate aldolase [Ruficoccus sp. ZRK36]QYY36793.1 bifunctional 4-hydroxy-2-oxoglutarate aldolase/2-dehydro-3-deoxy-phosphogluconate aldolase [Ruficoccus sp. ZRK36]
MSEHPAVTLLQEKRLLPVAVLEDVESGLKTAAALREGGLNMIEVTLRNPAAKEVIAAIIKEFPDMVVGAGTVLDPAMVQPLADMGVQFFVAPGLNEQVVEAAHKAGCPITPGVVTPSEVDRGIRLGCKVLKFFPAEPAGGAKMLKALTAAFGHTGVKFIPTGGINAAKAPEYWALKSVLAVGGSWFVAGDLVKAGKFDEIASMTKEALALAKA